MNNGQSSAEDVLKGALAGLAAGAVASWVMTKFQSVAGSCSEPQDEADAESATVKAARRLSRSLLNREIGEANKQLAGSAVHYGYGTMLGGIYGAAAEAAPEITAGRGLAYAAALWLGGDEIAVPALGLSKPPTEYPASTHVYALASHLVYGITLEGARRFFKPLV